MIRSYGNLKPPLPPRRCTRHQLSRSSASHKSIFPLLPQVASFDTTFHADLPEVARVLPISRALQLEGIQRNGFHGLSCESIVRQLAKGLPNRLVIAHLGNGASVTTVKGGKSIDTSGIDANRRGDHGHAVSIRRVPGRRWLNVNPPARQVILAAIGRRWRRESKPLVGSRLLDSLRKAFEG
jgi:hypothetical protein